MQSIYKDKLVPYRANVFQQQQGFRGLATPLTKRWDDAHLVIHTQQEAFHLAFGAGVTILYSFKAAGVSRIGYSTHEEMRRRATYNFYSTKCISPDVLRIGYSNQ